MWSICYSYIKQLFHSLANASSAPQAVQPQHPGLLERLPTELLAQIVEYLEAAHDRNSGDHRRDILALCLTTKTLSAVATPTLYHYFSNARSATTLGSFVRSVTQNPQLAKHVRVLELRFWCGSPSSAPTTCENRAFCEVIIPFAGEAPFYGRLRHALRSGSYDAEMALLLLTATQIEVLAINICDLTGEDENLSYIPGYGNGVSLVSQIIYLVATARHDRHDPFYKVLRRLKSAEFGLITDFMAPPSQPCESVAPLFKLPTEEFVGSYIGQLSVGQRWWDGSAASNVKRLCLYDCKLDTVSTVAILGSCRALESLSIIWRGNHGGPPVWERAENILQLDFAEVGKALQIHEATLVNLRLDTFSSDDVTIADTPGMGSLSSFTKLRTLDIDDRFIYGDRLHSLWRETTRLGDLSALLQQILPPTLDSFYLRSRKHISQLGNILKVMASCSTDTLQDFFISLPLSPGSADEMRVDAERSTGAALLTVHFEQHAVYPFEIVTLHFRHQEMAGQLDRLAGVWEGLSEGG